MPQYTIRMTDAVARQEDWRLREPVTLAFESSETVAIVGPNGAGKTLLVQMLTGGAALMERNLEYDFRPSTVPEAYKNIKYIAFKDTYGASDKGYYLQQRWNTMEYDDVPPVGKALGRYQESDFQRRLFRIFGIDALMDKPLIQLSSGELRKFQLTKMLLSRPRILIVDNPFVGLDAQTRSQLYAFFEELAALPDLQLILVLARLDEIPEFVTTVVPVEDMRVLPKTTRAEYLASHPMPSSDSLAELEKKILDLPYVGRNYEGDEVVRCNQVSIRYGDYTILSPLDWVVRRGDRWALSGENGSGKSTLLSLVCADNPQAYACDISLFGYQRGTGETIWDIKKHIGYVSPEMHRAYCSDVPVIDVVASGLHDRIGLFLKLRPEQVPACEFWMDVFGIGHLKDKHFLKISSGEQRLVLLARAFVKDPELLILDEPLHGLDSYNRARVRSVIQAWCGRRDKTLVMVTHYQEELPDVITCKKVLKKFGNQV